MRLRQSEFPPKPSCNARSPGSDTDQQTAEAARAGTQPINLIEFWSEPGESNPHE